jgi:hypothetical protein
MQNRKKFRLKSALYLILALLLTVAFFVFIFWPKNEGQKEISSENTSKAETTGEEPAPEPPKEVIIPAAYQLTVPYTVQAPNANWTVHEESCEEAAILMYHHYLLGSVFPNNIIPVATADTEMRKMKSWQVSSWGSEPDMTLEKMGEFAKAYYGYSYIVTKNVTEIEIKKAISENHPVLVPVITHSLGNPHYGRYPTYHILVITGYDTTGVITNDAGVKQGQNWHYNWDVLWKAIDQQTPQMKQGRDMLVLTGV